MGVGGIGGIGGGRGDLPLNAEINVTSLVDVMMVLLIVFMITAPMMQGGVDVELPRAEARPLEPKEGMVVTVDRSGRIFVDQTEVSYADFRVTFASLVAARKPSGVYLRGDNGVPYGEVVRVLAVIRGAGVQNVGLVAQEEDAAR
jgi:biopolymer transport protein ExbD/biopolymer transport protein TolR